MCYVTLFAHLVLTVRVMLRDSILIDKSVTRHRFLYAFYFGTERDILILGVSLGFWYDPSFFSTGVRNYNVLDLFLFLVLSFDFCISSISTIPNNHCYFQFSPHAFEDRK